MDLQKLKRVFGAARKLRGHNRLEDAAEVVGKSDSMINEVLAGRATSKPTEDAILDYCYEAGLEYNIKKLGLDPDETKSELNNASVDNLEIPTN